jgi:hypothetical protein
VRTPGHTILKKVVDLFSVKHLKGFSFWVKQDYNIMIFMTLEKWEVCFLTKFLKLGLGDTLRVVIYHNERHLAQAIRAVEV